REDGVAAVAGLGVGGVRRVADLAHKRRVDDARSRLQRLDPADAETYNSAFAELLAIESERRALRESA
ncbi:DNA primase, partial [Promicromonospora sp. NPDC060204]